MLRTIYSLTGVLFDLAMPGTKVYMGRVSYSCRLVELESRVPAVKVKQTETHSGNREKACSLDTTSGLAKNRQNFCHLRRVHWQASDKNWQKWIFRNAGLCPRGEAFRWPDKNVDVHSHVVVQSRTLTYVDWVDWVDWEQGSNSLALSAPARDNARWSSEPGRADLRQRQQKKQQHIFTTWGWGGVLGSSFNITRLWGGSSSTRNHINLWVLIFFFVSGCNYIFSLLVKKLVVNTTSLRNT